MFLREGAFTDTRYAARVKSFFAPCLFYFTVHRSRENLQNPFTFLYIIILVACSVASWYIYIPDFTNLVYFLDRLVGEIMVWYMSLNLIYFYAFW